jgi:multimeric flavodoxin WrbA
MKLLALNGSPRKGWNTEQLLQKAMDGADKSFFGKVSFSAGYLYGKGWCQAKGFG